MAGDGSGRLVRICAPKWGGGYDFRTTVRNGRTSQHETGISAPVRADREALRDANGRQSMPEECRFVDRRRSRWARTSRAGCTLVSSIPEAFSSQAQYVSACCSCQAANRSPARWARLDRVERVVRLPPELQKSIRSHRSYSARHALAARHHRRQHTGDRDQARFRSRQLRHQRGLSSTRVPATHRRSPSPAPSSPCDRERAVRPENSFQHHQYDNHGTSASQHDRARSQAQLHDSRNPRQDIAREGRTIRNHPNKDREIVRA